MDFGNFLRLNLEPRWFLPKNLSPKSFYGKKLAPVRPGPYFLPRKETVG